ncbi:MAG: hypothetical protein EAZ32_12345 [Cytophagia bacterium]|nr:MAG: hypothetical protein EAZ46_11790 [Runella sp.]TAG19210.1 MAG: hypothetical protein EAZ38_12980 [Cytophagales bacterium]TAG38479.1 MAG: hypothetical protein EAZ32_12345 [Cytophagia bacterium]TAG51640.1 MAG: hypothetical protein EAZ29_09135 [Runella slithyformis]TAG80071.1 MAG: hypothetical protein EAZ22_10290 [Cytophagales bacterium]
MKTTVKYVGIIAILLISFSTMAQFGGGGFGGRGQGGFGGGNGIPQTPTTPKKPPTADEMADEETKWMNKKLKLTEDQLLSVETLNLDYALRMGDYRDAFMLAHATARPTPQEVQKARETMEKWQVEKETKLQVLLTPEQWEIYQKKKKSKPGAQ